MIEGFWTAVYGDEADEVLTIVTEKSGKEFETGKVTVRKFYAHLYDGWDAYRLRFDMQRIRNRADRSKWNDVPGEAFCIVLVNRSDREMISLQNNSSFLYAVNADLGLTVTRENAADYLTFFGQVVHDEQGLPFNFVSRLSQVSDVESLTRDVAKRLDEAVRALFQVSEDGKLNLNLRHRTFPVLGTVYTLDMPCIYSGSVFKSTVRISASGYADMTDDNPLTIQDLDQLNPVRFYYYVDNPAYIVRRLVSAEKRLNRGQKLLGWPMILEKVFGLLAFPIFATFALILWWFGASDPVISAFFAKLPELGLLDWICLVLGGLIIIGSLVRFLFFEVARMLAKLVPNRFSMVLSQVEAQIRRSREVLGIPGFAMATFFEFILIPLTGAVVFAYGGLNVLADKLWSFVNSTALVLSSVPALPELGKWAFGINAFDMNTAGPLAIGMKWGLSAFFGTIVIGVVSRVVKTALSRET